MFKKANKLKTPQVPNMSQILEDLETFKIEKPISKRTRKISNSSKIDQEWWNIFETFLQDVEEFKDIESKLVNLKERLNNVNTEIIDISDGMKEDITKNLDKAKTEIPDL